MKTKYDILGDIRRMMSDFVGQTFTEDMRHRIRIEAVELMHAAYDEGQAALAPHVCSNKGTSCCLQTEMSIAVEEYEPSICRQCNLDGGFEL